MRPFEESERYWHLDRLRRYPDFVLSDPAWAFDPASPDVEAGRKHMRFGSMRAMGHHADRLCERYMGQRPPCQVSLFLYQFPDRDQDDRLYALWALRADRQLGPAACASAIAFEPFHYPFDDPGGLIAEETQYWAAWHLTRHPWAGPARQFAEKMVRTDHKDWRWLSERAQSLVQDYLRDNHENLDAFLAQPALAQHPLFVPHWVATAAYLKRNRQGA